jgi:hypothetical protein
LNWAKVSGIQTQLINAAEDSIYPASVELSFRRACYDRNAQIVSLSHPRGSACAHLRQPAFGDIQAAMILKREAKANCIALGAASHPAAFLERGNAAAAPFRRAQCARRSRGLLRLTRIRLASDNWSFFTEAANWSRLTSIVCFDIIGVFGFNFLPGPWMISPFCRIDIIEFVDDGPFGGNERRDFKLGDALDVNGQNIERIGHRQEQLVLEAETGTISCCAPFRVATIATSGEW